MALAMAYAREPQAGAFTKAPKKPLDRSGADHGLGHQLWRLSCIQDETAATLRATSTAWRGDRHRRKVKPNWRSGPPPAGTAALVRAEFAVS